MSTVRRLRLPLMAALLSCTGLVHAGPYETGSTSTAKTVKFKSNVQWKHTASKDTWVRPKLGVGMPINDHMEFSMGTGYGVIDPASGPSRGGMNDLSVGIKWRLRDEDDSHAAITIEPSLSVPTGAEDAGTGKGAYGMKLPLRVGRQAGSLRLTGEVNVARTFGQDADQVGSGLLLEYFGGPDWSCGVEMVADAPRTALDDWHLRANIGAKRKFGPHMQWQALLGRTVENRRGEAATTVKVVFEYLM